MELLCERVRSWASLHADGELSELESGLLDAHLGRCRSCRAFARGIEDVAAALAAARLERPTPLALLLPRRRRRGDAWARSTAAATLVVAAGLVTVIGGPVRHGSPSPTKPVAMVQAEGPNELRALRRASLITQAHPPVPRNRQDLGESY